MDKNKKQILENLDKINNLLFQVYDKLKEENKIRQFDYCTDATLARKVDEVERMSKYINDIVYQK